MPEISVVIPARDAAATLPRTLAALAAQEGTPEFEVVVVDDGSVDATARVAEEAGARVVLEGGRGPALARNAGARAGQGEVLAFTDADCFPAPGWLAAAWRAVAGADLVQGAVLPEPGVEVGPCDRTIWVTEARGLFETANLVVRRELFERLGGFESWLVPREGIELGEDVWFGWRARRAGARVAFAREALVHHAVFRGGWRDVVRARRRLQYFPALARRIPELREELLWGRVFLTRRSAGFDAAALGLAAALLSRRVAPLTLAAPYAAQVARDRRAAPVRLLGDAVGAASLVAGSVRYRSPVL